MVPLIVAAEPPLVTDLPPTTMPPETRDTASPSIVSRLVMPAPGKGVAIAPDARVIGSSPVLITVFVRPPEIASNPLPAGKTV